MRSQTILSALVTIFYLIKSNYSAVLHNRGFKFVRTRYNGFNIVLLCRYNLNNRYV